MIQLISKNISDETESRLKDLQKKVNEQVTFQKRVAKAKSLWGSKSSSVVGKTTFTEIKTILLEMCVSVEVCNYCEQNEANDIEHISPKSFFPEKAFEWFNYLLACKQCNSGYKLDKCFVLDTLGHIIDVKRGEKPHCQTTAFINPRIENPNDFLMLNMQTFEFELMPELSEKDKNKAEKTLEILKLNERAKLIEARESSAKYYFDRIERLLKILNSNNLSELKSNLTPYDKRFDFTQNLTQIKTDIKNSFKYNIQTYQHPSVWYAIKKVESKMDKDWRRLFAQIPEALTW